MKYSRNAEQHIHIFYRDIGTIGSAMGTAGAYRTVYGQNRPELIQTPA